MTYLKLKNLDKSITFKVDNSITSDSIINIPSKTGTICVAAGSNSGLSLNSNGEMSISTIDTVDINGGNIDGT